MTLPQLLGKIHRLRQWGLHEQAEELEQQHRDLLSGKGQAGGTGNDFADYLNQVMPRQLPRFSF